MSQRSDNIRGALLMMGSMSAFTINDAFIKSLSDELPLFQALTLRAVATSIVLAVLAWRTGALSTCVAPRDRVLVGLRSMAEVGAAVAFFTALFHMPFANVSAILQALPLTVTLAGALFLGERVGWRRMLTILIGLAGVLVIIRPGPEGFNAHAGFALIAVACVTLRDLVTRRMSVSVPSLFVALAASVAILTFAGAMSLGEDWQPVSDWAWVALVASTVFIMAGYLLSVMVMRVGEVTFTAPFRYTGLLWALVIGLVVFGEWPDALTMVGVALVVLAGFFMLWRERGGMGR